MSAQRKRSPRVSSKQKLINSLTKTQVDKVLCFKGTEKLGTNPSMEKKKQEIARRHTEDDIRKVLGMKRKASPKKASPKKAKKASPKKRQSAPPTTKAKKASPKKKAPAKRKSSPKKTKEQIVSSLSTSQLKNLACSKRLVPRDKSRKGHIKAFTNKYSRADLVRFVNEVKK